MKVPDSEYGHWSHSRIFTEVHTAYTWGLLPSQFRACSEQDKADMIAHDDSIKGMQDYVDYLMAEKARKKQKNV